MQRSEKTKTKNKQKQQPPLPFRSPFSFHFTDEKSELHNAHLRPQVSTPNTRRSQPGSQTSVFALDLYKLFHCARRSRNSVPGGSLQVLVNSG